mmetsp:Transcript_5050/g.6308  ORF Transcript_5050/g.6308 Transcript_5050/m.6308 type:complete len:588 (+) Transcript_5050:317-2080(+)
MKATLKLIIPLWWVQTVQAYTVSQGVNPSLRRQDPVKTRKLAGNCGCDTCTVDVWNAMGCHDDFGGCHTCGERISWLLLDDYTEEDACTAIGNQEFPNECGACDPQSCATLSPCTAAGEDNYMTGSYIPCCDGLISCNKDWFSDGNWHYRCTETCEDNPAPTSYPTIAPTSGDRYCGCNSCTKDIWDVDACNDAFGGCYTCGGRISWLMSNGKTEEDACTIVGNEEFPNECGNCDPRSCSTPFPTPAPIVVDSPTLSPASSNCGCEACNNAVWNADACDSNGNCYTCGDRISWLMSTNGGSNTEAYSCSRVSSEFTDVCGNCNPASCNPVYVPDPNPNELVWSDEFDSGSFPDASKWNYDIGGHGWGNGELQHYTDRTDNAYVTGGVLHIKAVKESYENSQYTSARLISKNKGDWLYGRVLVRAKLEHCTGRGTWPAIWMLPTDWCYGGWPGSGEIDIMEHVGYDTGRVHGTVHTDAYNHMIGTQMGASIELDVTKYHVYEIIWSPEKIEFVVDSLKYHEFVRDSTPVPAEWPFDQRFHLLLNVAVGGGWGGVQGVDSAAFEGNGQIMQVDWVRVYSKTTTSGDVCI